MCWSNSIHLVFSLPSSTSRRIRSDPSPSLLPSRRRRSSCRINADPLPSNYAAASQSSARARPSSPAAVGVRCCQSRLLHASPLPKPELFLLPPSFSLRSNATGFGAWLPESTSDGQVSWLLAGRWPRGRLLPSRRQWLPLPYLHVGPRTKRILVLQLISISIRLWCAPCSTSMVAVLWCHQLRRDVVKFLGGLSHPSPCVSTCITIFFLHVLMIGFFFLLKLVT